MTAICLVLSRSPVQVRSKLRPSYVKQVHALSDGGYANDRKATVIRCGASCGVVYRNEGLRVFIVK